MKVTDKITPAGKKFYREMKRLGKKDIFIGFQAGKAKSEDGADVATIAAYNELGTSTTPARPFLRQTADVNEGKIRAFCRREIKAVASGNKTTEEALKRIGVYGVGLVKKQIRHGDFFPNAPATIRKKKSNKPLIDTGRMRQSVTYIVRGGKWHRY